MTDKGSLYFSSGINSSITKIVVVSLVFHLLCIAALFIVNNINFKSEPEPIPVFEMVQVAAPVPRQVVHRPKPKVEPPKPKVKKELPPEPKQEEPKQEEPKPEPVEEVVEETTEEVTDDFPIDDMDLPTMDAPSLHPVGSVDMDPLMQVYLERLKQIIMQNFNPPNGMNIGKDAKTTVQFTVDRFGLISNITLKRSSGNKTWDHLSMRAIQIAKVPELPPNYRAPALSLNFNFTPK